MPESEYIEHSLGTQPINLQSLRVIIHSDYAQFFWEAVDDFGHKGRWILLLQTNNLCLLYFCDNMVEEGGVYILLANLFLVNFIINFVWSDGATVTREPLQTERVHARATVCMVCMHAHKTES